MQNYINFRFVIQYIFAGLISGYISWLFIRHDSEYIPFTFSNNNLSQNLLLVSVYTITSLGLIVAITNVLDEFSIYKAIHNFVYHSIAGLAFTLPATVFYTLLLNFQVFSRYLPFFVTRGIWWSLLALSYSLYKGFVTAKNKNIAIHCLCLMPSFVIVGIMFDKFFIYNNFYLVGFLFLGSTSHTFWAIGIEMCKEAWIEIIESTSHHSYQKILESEEFTIGSSIDCDLTIRNITNQAVVIVEKYDGHIIESLDNSYIKFSNCGFKSRHLVDGDVFEIGDTKILYRNRTARSRITAIEPA